MCNGQIITNKGNTLKLRIRHKLFLTILLTSSLVAGGLFLFLQWSFDRGFLNYVNNQELQQLNTMAEALTGMYDAESGWEKLQDNHMLWLAIQRDLFHRQLREVMESVRDKERGQRDPFFRQGKEVREGGPPGGRFGEKHVPPVDPVQFGRRLVLLDEAKNRVIGGPPELETDIATIPVKVEGVSVGYLGLIPASEISDSGDLLFVREQKETFALVAVMMLGISILLTFPVTIHLLRPINYLTEGTRKLIGGKFVTRVPVTSGDELGRLSEDFNILAMTLEKNEKARQRWIADISHELRTPLAVLRGEMEALLDGVRKTGPETLEPLHGEILHMQRLVNDLYELSMSDIGALTYRKVPVDPIGILHGTVELFEKRYAEKGVELRLNLPENSSQSMLGDPDRQQQLFTNLLENSLRYTDSPGMLEIMAEESGEAITISFQDSAPGVTEEQLPLLFERLYRTDPSRHRAKSGAGLGLAICTNIVEAHQGKVSSYASPHGGLGIEIELPVND